MKVNKTALSLSLLIGLCACLVPISSAQSAAGPAGSEQEFFDAIKKGNLQRVSELIRQQPSLRQASTKNGTTPILLAVYADHRDIAESIIASGVELNIFEASATGRIKQVRELLKKDPALAKAYSPDGWTALHLNFGNLPIAKLLLDRGADIDAVSKNKFVATPLQGAIVMERIDLARLFLDRGAKVNPRGEGGASPLHEAAGNGRIELAKLLLKRGADVNAKDDEGKTPLTIALESKHADIAELLKQHGGIQ